MASIINEVIKDAIKEANTRQLVLTPDNYMNVFCDIAKKKGVIVEDCQKLSKFISKLDPSYQTQLSKMNVNTIDELFAFITSRLNRQSSVDITKVFILLTKRILQSISLLHNKEARNLANISLETIDKRVSVENLEIIKDKWFDFLSNYDDSYLKHLEMYGVKQSDDLQKIINTILNSKISEQEDPELASLADLMIAALVPSIASSMNDELAAICEEIKAKPELLQSKAMQGDIKKIILKRV
ncbi:MAG: GGDEF domain-containing protein, partial [Campylobacter hyointestinalis]